MQQHLIENGHRWEDFLALIPKVLPIFKIVLSTPFCPKRGIQSHQRHPSLVCLRAPFISCSRQITRALGHLGQWKTLLQVKWYGSTVITKPSGSISLRGLAAVLVSKPLACYKTGFREKLTLKTRPSSSAKVSSQSAACAECRFSCPQGLGMRMFKGERSKGERHLDSPEVL